MEFSEMPSNQQSSPLERKTAPWQKAALLMLGGASPAEAAPEAGEQALPTRLPLPGHTLTQLMHLPAGVLCSSPRTRLFHGAKNQVEKNILKGRYIFCKIEKRKASDSPISNLMPG